MFPYERVQNSTYWLQGCVLVGAGADVVVSGGVTVGLMATLVPFEEPVGRTSLRVPFSKDPETVEAAVDLPENELRRRALSGPEPEAEAITEISDTAAEAPSKSPELVGTALQKSARTMQQSIACRLTILGCHIK